MFGWFRKTSSATAVLSPQVPVGLISPCLKLSPPISPQVPVGLISSSWGGTQTQVWMPKAANEACHQGSWPGAVQRDDDSSSCLLPPSLTHRQLERRPLQRDDRAVCGWPHGLSPRDHKSTCVYLARAPSRLAPWPSPARSGTKASLTTGADAAARAPVAVGP